MATTMSERVISLRTDEEYIKEPCLLILLSTFPFMAFGKWFYPE